MAREGWPFIIASGSLAVIHWVLASLFALSFLSYLACGWLLLAGFIAFFFRDPERLPPEGEGMVVSGGDGRVVAVSSVDHDPWLESAGIRVSVFLSIFNVHINRIPISGQIDEVHYRPGKFKLAFVDKASDNNEQTIVRISTPSSVLVVKQIAGFVARRIVCRLAKDETVHIGQRFGLIKFGSRIDHILPANTEIKVSVGDRVKAGETVIGVTSHEN